MNETKEFKEIGLLIRDNHKLRLDALAKNPSDLISQLLNVCFLTFNFFCKYLTNEK